MTSIDNLADEIMKGLTEYADLAETEMKKAVRKTATSVKKEISAKAPKKQEHMQKAGQQKRQKKTAIHLK